MANEGKIKKILKTTSIVVFSLLSFGVFTKIALGCLISGGDFLQYKHIGDTKVVLIDVDDIENGSYGLGDAADIEDFKNKYRDKCKQQKEICETILNTPNLKKVFLEELESYKDKNINTLKAYGFKPVQN